MEHIENTKKIIKVQKELMTCVNKNCKKVATNYKVIYQKAKNEVKKLLLKYDKNEIKEKELLLLLIEILKKIQMILNILII